MVDFRRLSSFMRIADAGSLSRAADLMRIAQPALSRQMRLLEGELGIQLFARHRRGMQLTPAGEELRSRLSGPLRQIDLIVEDVRALSSQVGGNVVIGLPPTVSLVLAGPLARRVVEQAPMVSLRAVESYSAHLVDWLQKGTIDLAILYGPAADLRLRSEELLDEDICLVGGPNSPLHPDASVPFAALRDHPLILPSRPHGLRIIADNAAAKAGVRLNIRFEADSFVLMKELVEQGLGLSLMPYSAFARDVAAGRLRWAPLHGPSVRRHLVLAMQPGASLRAAQTLRRLIHSEIAALHRLGLWSARLAFPVSESEDDA